jgi:hypothetical protein
MKAIKNIVINIVLVTLVCFGLSLVPIDSLLNVLSIGGTVLAILVIGIIIYVFIVKNP